jgi:predicted short-subunit dehydrogenase-like oxidoreductase (DUF2520 family)
VVSVSSRSPDSAAALARQIGGCRVGPPDAADLVLITVPDTAIAEVGASLRWRQGQFAVHCAGSVGREALAVAAQAGAIVGAWHPLQSLAHAEASLHGSRFAIDAPPPLDTVLIALTEAVGGAPLAVPPEGRTIYHLGATIVSNYAVALVALAAELWTAIGIDRSTAVAALAPLLAGTAANLRDLGLPQALTGPIARGDVATVDRHLAALQWQAPDLVPLYRDLGLAALRLASERGLADDRVGALRARLLTAIPATTSVGGNKA